MKQEIVRYWTVEHGFGMIVAIVIAHIGRIRMRKAMDAVAKTRAAATWFTIAILIMLITIPWPFMKYARPLFRIF